MTQRTIPPQCDWRYSHIPREWKIRISRNDNIPLGIEKMHLLGATQVEPTGNFMRICILADISLFYVLHL